MRKKSKELIPYINIWNGQDYLLEIKKKTVMETLLIGRGFHLKMQNKILRGSLQQGDNDDVQDFTLNCGPLVCALISTEGTWGQWDASFSFLFKNGIF